MSDRMSQFQSVRLPPPGPQTYQRRPRQRPGCAAWIFGILLVLVGVYFLAPFPTNLLLLGIDRSMEGTAVGRSDTIILIGVRPLQGKVSMLSIPRDLWVFIPQVGENRINTVHFFAEAAQPGSGPAAVMDLIQSNFQVPVPYYARIQLENFAGVIDALGGVTLVLDEPASIYPAGSHHLDGTQALAFVRDRSGSDDFSRMAQGQLLLKSLVRQCLRPSTWIRFPAVLLALDQAVDSNVPAWMWPRLGLAFLRSLPAGLDNRTLTRDEVTPFTTAGGANVLLPQWEKILPIVEEMFQP